MEQHHKTAIRKSWTTLVQSLTHDQVVNMIDHLTTHDMLTMSMRETIECETQTTAKIRALLTIIQKRGPRAFTTFVDALLHAGAGHVTEKLLANVSTPELPTPRPTVAPPTPHPVAATVQDTNDSMICNICLDNRISVAFDPCGHTVCSTCADRLTINRLRMSCCYCHTPIVRNIRIFIG